MELFILNMTSVVSAVSATYLCLKDKKGWGWFLLVAFLCYGGL